MTQSAHLRTVFAATALIASCLACTESPVCPTPTNRATAAALQTPLYVGATDPYTPGPLPTQRLDLAVCEQDAPLAMTIFSPAATGRYPVVLFQHGFVSSGPWYSEILTHLASHGFVVVAPQMYAPLIPVGTPPIAEEIARAIRVLDWLPAHLNALTGVEADTTLQGLAGHSRGGKVAWGLLVQDPSRAGAVAGLDPVDGSMYNQASILSGPVNFPFPSLVIGAGLGSVPVTGGNMACAPEGDNHVQFYAASASPAWHVVAPDAGHADFYDPNCQPCGFIERACRPGANPAGSRQLAAGLLVAFFRATLQNDPTAYAYLTNPAAAPIPIETESR